MLTYSGLLMQAPLTHSDPKSKNYKMKVFGKHKGPETR